MEDSSILAILKIFFMALFVGIVVMVGTIPLRLATFKTNRFLRSMGTTFAGALFVNVSIIHILPESFNTIQDYLKEQSDTDQQVFPLANLLLMLGFLTTIFFTRILATHSHNHDSFEGDASSQPILTPKKASEPVAVEKSPSVIQPGHALENGGQDQDNPIVEEQPTQKPTNHQDTYFLTLAMYFHTLFEGIAIGVQDTIAGFLSTAIAIAFHKWADALSMGIQYRNRGIRLKIAYWLIIGQAALNAFAIGLGWIITNFGDLTEAVFLAISAGTFLAISTMEMLGEELHRPSYRAQKFAVLLFATGFISAVWFFENAIFS